MPRYLHGKRDKPISTKGGIILHHSGGDHWQLQYPDGFERYGGATTIRVMNFIYYLSRGKSVEEADEIAFERPRKRVTSRKKHRGLAKED